MTEAKGQLAEAVRTSVTNVFRDMLGLDAQLVETKTDHTELVQSDVSGIIGIAGGITGSIVFHTRKDLAKTVAGTFLGMEVQEVNDEVRDVVGEMANMIAGGANTLMSGTALSFEISLPTVVSGEKFDIRPLTGSDPWTSLRFSAGGMDFAVDLCVKEDKKAG